MVEAIAALSEHLFCLFIASLLNKVRACTWALLFVIMRYIFLAVDYYF